MPAGSTGAMDAANMMRKLDKNQIGISCMNPDRDIVI
jgi:hypothetical protein